MGYFGLLEANVIFEGKKVLDIGGQVNCSCIGPEFSVLITGVKSENRITPPYKMFDTDSLEKFINNLYRYQFSLIDPLKYPDAQVQINIKRADSIDD